MMFTLYYSWEVSSILSVVAPEAIVHIRTKYPFIERFRRWFYSVIMGRRSRDRMVVKYTTTFSI